MYDDLVYRPGEDSYRTRDLVFRPGVDTTIAEKLPYIPRPHTSINPEVEKLREVYDRAPFERGPGSGGGIVPDRPAYPGIDERPRTYDPGFGPDFMNKIDEASRLAKAFLDMYLLKGPETAGYIPFIPVAPSDIDPGGSEPEAEAEMADYVRRRRERGDFDRARDRLRQMGFPLGGV